MAETSPSYPTLEERVRLAHAERSYLIGTMIGDGLAALVKGASSLFHHAPRRETPTPRGSS